MKTLWKFPSLYILFNVNNTGFRNALINIKGYKEIKKNELFDYEYYLKNNSDVNMSQRDPLLHYIYHGFKENRRPNPEFDGNYYLQENDDVRETNLNPLVHYCIYGFKEKRKINDNKDLIINSGLFDAEWYKKEYENIDFTVKDPVDHYLETGSSEGKNPNPNFDGRWYLEKYYDVDINPLIHYIKFGMAEERKTKPTPEDLIKVIQLTKDHTHNPYFIMVGDELISRDINLRYIDDLDRVEQILKQTPCIIHLHQPEPYYHGTNREETILNAQKFLDKLKNFKELGGRLVFTMHNPVPHNRMYQSIDHMVNNELWSISDHIIVLGKYPKEILVKEHHLKTPVTMIKHPSYREYYGDANNKIQARKELGLPIDATIFGSIGQIKPYKKLEFILDAFKKFLDTEKMLEKHVLCLAGASPDQEYSESLKETYESKNIIIKPNNFSDDELITYVSALDYSVFAFKDIWASGSVVLSISYGVPVIVPELGCLDEYIQQLNNGLLYKPHDQDSLVETFKQATNLEYYEHLQYMCDAYSEEHTITQSADELFEVYKKVL